MKKKIIIPMALLALSGISFGESPESVPFTENINKTTEERTFYNKGFKDGYDSGKRDGYAEALKAAEMKIAKYKMDIMGWESGKYLSSKGKVTPPRIYQKRKGGKFEVVVKGCEVRGELSPSDILSLPLMDDEVQNIDSGTMDSGTATEEYSDGVYLNGVDNEEATAIPTSSLKQTSVIVLRDTKFYRDLLRSSGILYTVEGNGGGLKAIFKNPRERESFVTSYDLEYGKDYR